MSARGDAMEKSLVWGDKPFVSSVSGRIPLISGLLAAGDVGAIVGAPGSGKSCLGPYIAHAVATGRSVFGIEPLAGRVIYAAAEDHAGILERFEALRLTRGAADELAVLPIGNLLDRDEMEGFIQLVDSCSSYLVIIDTIGAAFAGMSENESSDMGLVVRLARRLTKCDAAVLLIHHTSKGGQSPRGHSVLNGTLDLCLSLAEADSDGVVKARLTKCRNGTTNRADLAFRIHPAVISAELDYSITAPMCVEVAPSGSRDASPLSPTESAALATLRAIGETMPDGRARATDAAFRQACEDRQLSTSPSPVNRSKCISRTLRELVRKRAIHTADGFVWCGSASSG